MKSKYLETFKRLAELGKGSVHSNLLRIEIVQTPGMDEEGNLKSESGKILLATSSSQRSDYNMLKPIFGVVLEAGEGYFDPDTKETVPLDIKVGNVVWVPAGAMGRLSVIPEIGVGIPDASMAFVNETEVRKSWPSIEAFMADYELLKGGKDGE